MTHLAPGALSELTSIDGLSVDTSETELALAGGDFGRIARGRALAQVRPSTTEHLRELVAWARRHGQKLTVRGGGMSQSGQSVANESVSIDMSRCNEVEEPKLVERTIVCGAGATWRQVLSQTLRSRLAPAVAPLNLDLTVGGTLSAGGFGSSSHRNGVAASSVVSAEVVLGNGEVVRCGASTQRDVFDAVFGGVGRVGIIRKVELALEQVPDTLRTHFLVYDELETMLADQVAIVASGQAVHLESFCSASIQGLRRGPSGRRQPLTHWLYGLHVTSSAHPTAPTSAKELFPWLRCSKQLHVEDEGDYAAFASRYDARFDGMRLTGAWEHAHPWFEVLLPLDAAAAVVRRALEILPPFIGDGHRLLILGESDAPAAMAFPKGRPVVIFGVFPIGIPPALREPALAALASLNETVASAGGKRYLSGWLFEMSSAAWEAHYGSSYLGLLEAQRRFDPDRIFRSMLAPL
jgi:cytokinin dehydrogenase